MTTAPNNPFDNPAPTELFFYDTHGNLDAYIDENGEGWDYRFDQQNRLVELALPDNTPLDPLDNSKWWYGYDKMGNRTQMTNPDGESTKYEYNDRNWLAKLIDPALYEFEFYYDGEENLTKRIDGRDQETDYTYMDRGLLASSTNAAGKTASNSYNDAGERTKMTDEAGNETEVQYYPTGEVSREIDALGRERVYGYLDGRLVGISLYDDVGTLLWWQQYFYDERGRLTLILDGGGASIGYTYDHAGNVTDVNEYDPTLGLRRQTDYDYDDQNRLIIAKIYWS